MTTNCIATELNPCASTADRRQSALRKLWATVNGWWLETRRRCTDRQAIRYLSTLDDAVLRDIGVNRGDVEWAGRLPSSVDASVQLEIIARGGGRRR